MDWKSEIIIGFSKTKRYIRGPFEICGDREVLRSIAHQILHETEDDRVSGGWITIIPTRYNNAMTNLVPVEWD